MKDSPTRSRVLPIGTPPYPNCPHRNYRIGESRVTHPAAISANRRNDRQSHSEIREGNLHKAQLILKEAKQPEATGYTGPEGWRKMCECSDLDLIFICTDWLTHAQMASYAMECGKHVAIEVPAAMNIAECWQLVDTAEKTRRHCIMLENCCYDPFALTTLGNGTPRCARRNYACRRCIYSRSPLYVFCRRERRRLPQSLGKEI